MSPTPVLLLAFWADWRLFGQAGDCWAMSLLPFLRADRLEALRAQPFPSGHGRQRPDDGRLFPASRRPGVFTRRTQKPFSSLWKVTRSISPEISSVVGLRCGVTAFMHGDSFPHGRAWHYSQGSRFRAELATQRGWGRLGAFPRRWKLL